MTTTTDTAAEITIIRSGFPWEDVDYRFCATSAKHFAYGSTPEIAQSGVEELAAEYEAAVRKVDNTGLVWQKNERGNEKIIGEIHRSKADRFKVVMVGQTVAKSILTYSEAERIALDWEPADDQSADILRQILGD